MNYKLRSRDELLAEVSKLAQRKYKLQTEYDLAMKDLENDIQVVRLELALLKSMGKLEGDGGFKLDE